MTLDASPTFILSAPRSGTTWLVQALSAHPDVYASELRAFGDYVDVVHDEGAAKPRLRITLDAYLDALLNPHPWPPLGPSRDAVRDQLLREVYETIRRHAMRGTGRPIFVDKITPYLGTADSVVATIGRLFPDAKIILLVRDGRDVAVSGVMHWLTKDIQAMSEFQQRRRAFFADRVGAPLDRFFDDGEVQQWASHWRQPADALAGPGAALHRVVVRYEEMSRDLAGALRRVCEFLGVSTADGALRACTEASTFERMSGGRRRGDDSPGAHVRKGVVGDWRQYFTAADASAFDRIAGPTMAAWGYEPDSTWTRSAPQRLP